MTMTSTPGHSSPAPAILGHCKQVYAAMEEKAKSDAEGNKYFEGALTRLVAECGLSNPYYTSITQALKAMDCIRQGRRGGGGIGSIWFLLQEPTEELFAAYGPERRPTSAARAVEAAQLDQALKALNVRVSELELKVALLEEGLA